MAGAFHQGETGQSIGADFPVALPGVLCSKHTLDLDDSSVQREVVLVLQMSLPPG